MARRCSICALSPKQRLQIEYLLNEGVLSCRRIAAKTEVLSHVSLARHQKGHMKYPPLWDFDVKNQVLEFGRKTKPKDRRKDVFQPRDWDGWKQYLEFIRKSKRQGYHHGYELTRKLMAWKDRATETERASKSVLIDTIKNPRYTLNLKVNEERSSRRHGTIRYRFGIGYDGRSYVKSYNRKLTSGHDSLR